MSRSLFLNYKLTIEAVVGKSPFESLNSIANSIDWQSFLHRSGIVNKPSPAQPGERKATDGGRWHVRQAEDAQRADRHVGDSPGMVPRHVCARAAESRWDSLLVIIKRNSFITVISSNIETISKIMITKAHQQQESLLGLLVDYLNYKYFIINL